MKKNYLKKTVALLATAVLTCTALAGCGSSPGTPTSTGTSESKPQESASQEGTQEQTPASDPQEIVDLVWYSVGNGMPDNYDAWKANLDAYLEEKIGVHLDVQVVSWSDWDGRRNTIVSTNEPYDIMFTNLGTYSNDVSIGAFADITELVKSASPELYNFIPEDYWGLLPSAARSMVYPPTRTVLPPSILYGIRNWLISTVLITTIFIPLPMLQRR